MGKRRDRRKSASPFGSGSHDLIAPGRPIWPPPGRWKIFAGIGGVIFIVIILGTWRLLSDQRPHDPTDPVSPVVPEITSAPPITATAILTTPLAPDLNLLRDTVRARLNRERRALGLDELARDIESERAGQKHAEEMAEFDYANSWNLSGFDPAYRYALEGGIGSLTEHTFLYQDVFVYHQNNATAIGGSAPNVWQIQIEQLLDQLIEDSSYRTLVENPVFSHIGIGVGYDISSGRLVFAQEFVSKYVSLQPLIDLQYTIGETIMLEGTLDLEAHNPIVDLAYAPLPIRRELTMLRLEPFIAPETVYTSGIAISVDSDNQFHMPIQLDHQNQPGLYIIRVLVDVAIPSGSDPRQIVGSQVVVRVEGNS